MAKLVPFLTFSLCIACAVPAPAQQPQEPQQHPARLKALVLGGVSNHDVAWTTPSLKEILFESGRFDVATTNDPTSGLRDPASNALYDVFVLDYNGPRWGEPAETNFLNAVRGGKGVVVVHAANNAFPGWVEYEKLVGLCWRDGTGHGVFHPYDVEVVDHYHPITHGMRALRKHPDELYHRLVHMHGVELRVLLSAYSAPERGGSGRFEPMAVVLRYGEGRVFHTALGHVWTAVPQSRASHADPQFRQLLARGTEWAATGRVTLAVEAQNTLATDETAEGFMLLFDGKDVAQWRGYRAIKMPAQGWSVVDGALVHGKGGGGGDLASRDEYGDFDLRFEWRIGKGGNSGVIFRADESSESSWMTGPEFQLLDDADAKLPPGSDTGSGALYALAAAPDKELRPAGEWNRGRIVVRGWRVQHWVNDVPVVDLDLAGEDGKARIAKSKFASYAKFAKLPRGRIVLQDHGDEVAFRNIRIRDLTQ